jgi:hypothetical protein
MKTVTITIGTAVVGLAAAGLVLCAAGVSHDPYPSAFVVAGIGGFALMLMGVLFPDA